jgi:anti-sigma factor RsiW
MEDHSHRHISEELLEQYAVSGSLPEAELAPLEEHLLICPDCQDPLKELDEFIATMRLALQKDVN